MPLSQGGGLSVIGGLSLRGGLSVGSGFSPVLGPTLNLPFSTLSADQMTTLGVTFSRPSQATMVDATGKITYAPNNLLLNSATLSTQSVTVNPASYILSFKGTGTVTLSGASTAGPLVGTGATDRVYLKITPTAGSLTCTVSGSVTEAQLEAVTYETAPRTYNATTSAAYYGPRFTYDPVTLAAQGLLVEEGRTNICLQANNFDIATWAKSNVTVTADQLAAPDGATSADLVTSGNLVNQGIYQALTVTASTAYTFSFYARLGSMAAASFKMAFRDDTAGVFIAEDVVPSQTPTSSGWTRITYAVTTPVGCLSMRVYPFRNTAAVAGTFYLWGAQLEAGSFATSPIPTFGTALARSADSASMTGTNFSSWFNPSEGTFVVEAATSVPATASRLPFSVTDGTFNNAIYSQFTAAVQWNALIRSGGAQTGAFTAQSVAATTSLSKQAVAYKLDDFALSTNGGAVATDLSGAIPVGVNRLQIGGDWSGTGNVLNGTIKSIRYYPTRLSNAHLQALST